MLLLWQCIVLIIPLSIEDWNTMKQLIMLIMALMIMTNHYNAVIVGAMVSQITSLTIVYSTVYSIQAQIIENIKAADHWHLWGEFTGHRWIPRQWRGKEKVSIWWRHHEILMIIMPIIVLWWLYKLWQWQRLWKKYNKNSIINNNNNNTEKKARQHQCLYNSSK